MWLELLSGVAWAGSCCGATTTTAPTRVGETERFAVGLTVGFEEVVGRWDGAALLRETSLDQHALTTSLVAGVRVTHWLQTQAALPARWGQVSDPSGSEWGGGLSDATLGVVLDPWDEGSLGARAPVPVFTLGTRLPTGRDWTESKSPRLADITGQPGVGLLFGVSFERFEGTTPWSVALDAAAGPGAPAAFGISGSLGHAIGEAWSVSGGLRHAATFAGEGTHRTTLSATVVHGERNAWRVWGGLSGDVPVPGLGRHQTAVVSTSIGAAFVR